MTPTIIERLIILVLRIASGILRMVYNPKRVWTYRLHKLSNSDKSSFLNGKASGLSKRLYIGQNVHINANFEIHGSGAVHIGDHSHIGCNCLIITSNHDWKDAGYPYRKTEVIRRPVHIDQNVWIGRNVIILPGAHIGEGAIVQAGSTVSGRIWPGQIYSSNPRQIIGER